MDENSYQIALLRPLAGSLVALGLGWWVHRSAAVPWHAWRSGMVTYVVTLLATVAFGVAFGLVATWLLNSSPWATDPNSAPALLRWLLGALAIGGLIVVTELVRYHALRHPGTQVHNWHAAIMFAAGYSVAEGWTDAGRSGGKDILASLITGEALPIKAPLWLPLADVVVVWEGCVFLAINVALTLLVLRTVQSGRRHWFWLAVLAHSVLSLAILFGTLTQVLVWRELILALAAACVIVIILVLRRDKHTHVVPPTGGQLQPS